MLVGLVRLIAYHRSDGLTLIGLAIVIEYLVRVEARSLEDGGYFEDGVFGYDFSEGYTSLESSTPKVRPSRESAVKRWRRRRSELRRQRRVGARPPKSRESTKSSKNCIVTGEVLLPMKSIDFSSVSALATETGQNPVNEALPHRTSVDTEMLSCEVRNSAVGNAAAATRSAIAWQAARSFSTPALAHA